MRHAATGKYYHTTDFSFLDEDLLKELKGIENQVLHDRRSTLLINKFHLVNDILINYGNFIKVYTIQKKFRYLNIGDQEKVKRRKELTSFVHSQFNGMYTIHAMFQDSVRKNYKPVNIFIYCSISLLDFDNSYFSIDPKSAFPKSKNASRLFSTTTAIDFLDMQINSTNILNTALDVRVSYIHFKMTILNVMKITLSIRKIFLLQ